MVKLVAVGIGSAIFGIGSDQPGSMREVYSHVIVQAGDRDGVAPAVAVLQEAQQRRPEVVTDLLAHPWTGAWLAGAARRIQAGEPAASDLARAMINRSS